MSDKLQTYHEGTSPIENTNRLWPLYGAGLENLGQDGKPIAVPTPACGPDDRGPELGAPRNFAA